MILYISLVHSFDFYILRYLSFPVQFVKIHICSYMIPCTCCTLGMIFMYLHIYLFLVMTTTTLWPLRGSSSLSCTYTYIGRVNTYYCYILVCISLSNFILSMYMILISLLYKYVSIWIYVPLYPCNYPLF